MLLGSWKNRRNLPQIINWTKNPIKLLGIFISNNSNESVMTNFESKVEALLRQLHWWKARDLSLRGKVLIVKALALSKFQYLASLVTIPEHIIRQVNSMVYEFIWNGKTDKVKWHLFQQEFKRGGYKMINLADTVSASSIMWVKKYLDTTEREWKHTFDFFSKQRNMRAFLRSNFEPGELPACMPTYYMSAIKNWSSLSEGTTDEIACQPVWYNKELKIGSNSAYNNNLFSIGIWYIGDLFEGGNVILFEVWRRRGAREADRMIWCGIVKCITKKWNIQQICNDQSIQPLAFSCGLHINSSFINIEKVTQKQVKLVLSEKKPRAPKESDHKYKMKHESIQGLITDKEWESIFMVPALAPVDNKIKDLQYKIIMRFTPTNNLLYKIKKIGSPTCNFCNLETETIEHLFFDCTHVKDIWLFAFAEFQKLTGFHFVPTLRNCILGIYDVNDENSRIINTIMLLVKMYIMKCKYETCDLSRLAFVRMFAHKVMLLSRTQDNDIFVQLAQMFVGT